MRVNLRSMKNSMSKIRKTMNTLFEVIDDDFNQCREGGKSVSSNASNS